MKTIYLLRHAKSGHEEYIANDIERHLSARGYKDAEEQAVIFKTKYKTPELIVSSPAIRAFTTALIFSKHLGYRVEHLQTHASIYEASVQQLLYVISELDDQYKTVMFFGHNPGFTDLTNTLCGYVIDNLPTAGVAVIQLNVAKWGEVEVSKGKLLKDY